VVRLYARLARDGGRTRCTMTTAVAKLLPSDRGMDAEGENSDVYILDESWVDEGFGNWLMGTRVDDSNKGWVVLRMGQLSFLLDAFTLFVLPDVWFTCRPEGDDIRGLNI